MADEQNVVKRIVWSEVFSFPQVFKSFKMARHPSKLALGLAALVLVFVGGFVMDKVWSLWGGTAQEGEIARFISTSPTEYQQVKLEAEKSHLTLRQAAELAANAQNQRHSLSAFIGAWSKTAGNRGSVAIGTFGELLTTHNTGNESGPESDMANASKLYEDAIKAEDRASDLIDKADKEFCRELDKIDTLLHKVPKAAEEAIEKKQLKGDEEDKAKSDLDYAMAAAWQAFSQRKLEYKRAKRNIEGVGLFKSFVGYEIDCLNNAVMAVRYLNFTGGLAEYSKILQNRRVEGMSLDVRSGLPDPSTAGPKDDTNGFLFYLLLMAEGVRWLILEHWVYAAIFLVWTLAVWALAGGAIHRIAALEFAREEKISIMQALRFSRQKFLSFFFAPLVPLAAILVVAGLLALGGFIFSIIPIVGPLLMAILFFLALLMGLGVAFLVVGLAAGWPLMYPTIAVEGSDSFDAISRSFSYVYARPFRAAFYGAVAAVYGAITYLFVRFFAYLALAATHTFVKWGYWDLWGHPGERLSPNADLVDALWQRPTFWHLYQPNWVALNGWNKVVAVILGIWLVIVVGLVASYLLTFLASSATSIYYVLRRRVDATDLDDVYVEEEETPSEAAAPSSEESKPAEDEASDEKK